jgi:hypothetical protein
MDGKEDWYKMSTRFLRIFAFVATIDENAEPYGLPIHCNQLRSSFLLTWADREL